MSRKLRNFASIGFSVFFGMAAILADTGWAQDSWTQWGGDHGRNFSVPDAKFSEKPEFEQLWLRDLGGGYSGVLCEGERLFTLFRDGDDEIATSLDAATGGTVWEYRYNATIPEEADKDFGEGPNSTPIIVGDRIITVGFLGDMHCLNKETGEVVWKTSLWKDHDATPLGFGFSASPIFYDGNIILPIGGKGRTLKAFKIDDGSVAWSALDYANSYSTPLLIDVEGVDQLVLSLTESVIGVSPANGEELWSFPLKNQWDTHAFVPVWDERNNVLFISSFRQTHALKLSREGEGVKYNQKWSINKTGIGFTNAVRVGDVIYGTSGGTSAPLITAFDLNQGKVLWKERGFGISNLLAVGDRLLLLDEKGNLAIADPTADSLNVMCQERVLDSQKGWTFPTIVGNTVYVRNQKQTGAIRLK